MAFAAILSLTACGGGSGDEPLAGAPRWFGDPLMTDLGGVPHSLVWLDLNSDGNPDVAFALADGSLYIALGNGNGTFQPARQLEGVTGVGPIAVGDLNGDGNPDLVIVGCEAPACPPAGPSLLVLLGNGDGSFQAPIIYGFPGPNAPVDVAIGDFNGDGRADVVVDRNTPAVSFLLGNGDGSLGAPTDWPISLGQIVGLGSISAADLNGDGKPDLVATFFGSFGYYGIVTLFGHGDGTFGPSVAQVTTYQPGNPTFADFNGDGHLDMVISGNYVAFGGGAGRLTIYPGKGDGTFGAPMIPDYPTGFDAPTFAVGDVNRDGAPDIVLRSTSTSDLSILLGNGDGTFAAPQTHPLTIDGAAVWGLVDLNSDGRLDLVLVTSSGIAVLLGIR